MNLNEQAGTAYYMPPKIEKKNMIKKLMFIQWVFAFMPYAFSDYLMLMMAIWIN